MIHRSDPNAEGQQQLALLFCRVGAYLVDIALLFALLAPIGFAVQLLLDFTPTGREIWFVLLVNFSLPSWLYFIFFECRRADRPWASDWSEYAFAAARQRASDGRTSCFAQ